MTARDIAPTTCAYKPAELHSLCGTSEAEEPQINPVLAKLTCGHRASNHVDFI